jgi:hypothetical protein
VTNYGGTLECFNATSDTNMKSVSGTLTYINGNLISWNSKKQNTVAQSSCESEYYAANLAANSLLWLKSLLLELGVTVPTMLLFCDNTAAISVANSAYTSRKLRHVLIAYHHIKDLVANGTITLQYVNTKQQLADVLTKPLTADVFGPLANMLVCNNNNNNNNNDTKQVSSNSINNNNTISTNKSTNNNINSSNNNSTTNANNNNDSSNSNKDNTTSITANRKNNSTSKQ